MHGSLHPVDGLLSPEMTHPRTLKVDESSHDFKVDESFHDFKVDESFQDFKVDVIIENIYVLLFIFDDFASALNNFFDTSYWVRLSHIFMAKQNTLKNTRYTKIRFRHSSTRSLPGVAFCLHFSKSITVYLQQQNIKCFWHHIFIKNRIYYKICLRHLRLSLE